MLYIANEISFPLMNWMYCYRFAILLGFFFVLSSLRAQFSVQSFNLVSEATDVRLQWKVASEEGLSEFRIYRKIGDQGSFDAIATLSANGSLSYEYLDENVFKVEAKIVTYMLRVIKNGRDYDFYSSVTHSPTSVQRTWGSIKSMFR